MTTRCGSSWAMGQRCGEDATHEVVSGCVHEHLKDHLVCDEDLGLLHGGAVACKDCWEATDAGHLCAVAFIRSLPLAVSA